VDRPTDPVNTEHVPDTGDLIDPHAYDPQPQPVDDPDDPSYVEPAHAAVRVDATRMVPADDPATSLGAALLADQQLPAAHADEFPEDHA
jgi:hypothetical protein